MYTATPRFVTPRFVNITAAATVLASAVKVVAAAVVVAVAAAVTAATAALAVAAGWWASKQWPLAESACF